MLIHSASDIVYHADTSTELRIRSALDRRCLAFDQADILAYAVQEAWISYMFQQLFRSPPANYNAVTMEQVLQADKCLWIRLAELPRRGISAPGGQDQASRNLLP